MKSNSKAPTVIGSHLCSALRAAGIELVFTVPAMSLDDILFNLCEDDQIRVVVASSELAALDAAQAFWQVSDQAVAVVLDAEFCLPGALEFIEHAVKSRSRVVFVCVGELTKLSADAVKGIGVRWQEMVEEKFAIDTLDVGPMMLIIHQSDNVELRGARKVPDIRQEDNATVSVDDVAADMAVGGSWVMVLPELGAATRTYAERVVLSLGISTVTTQGHDNFAQRHPELWLGRIGFASSRNVVELLGEPQIERTRLLMTERSTLPLWIRETPSYLGMESVNLSLQPTIPRGISRIALDSSEDSSRGSALTLIVEGIKRLAPDALFVADAGASHRVVASVVANSGNAALMTDGLTPMGWSLRATLGAAKAIPGRLLVPVLGDGAALIQMMDLAILAKNQVPALVILAVNGTLGLRVAGTPLGDVSRIPAVDWALVGQALGCSGPSPSRELSDDELKAWIGRALSERRPVLIPVDTRDGTLSDYTIPTGIADLDG